MYRTPILLSLTILLVTALHAAAPVTSTEEGITLELEKIKETRRRILKQDEDAGFSMFDTPGLELRFGLRIPEGRQVVSIGQPTSITAVDDGGTDLSKLPKLGYGEPQHVQLISEWEKPPHALDFKLALPLRSAKTFSLTAQLEAVTYTDTQTVTLEPGREWSAVDSKAFGDEAVKVRLESKQGAVHLTFTPGEIRERVESVVIEVDGRDAGLDSQGVMWNPQQVAFMFEGAISKPEAITAKVEVRRGLRTIPVEIELKEIELP